MRATRQGLGVFAALSTLCASAAHAQDEGAAEVGLRTGFGYVLGKATGDMDDDEDLNDGVEAAIPIALDVGYRFTPEFFVGLYGQYAFGFPGESLGPGCGADDMGIDCSVADMRLGLQLHYHILPGETVDPFIGVGFGLEWLAISFENSRQELSITGFGVEFVNLQFGLDIAVAPHLYVGPFGTLTLGQYMELSFDCSGGDCPTVDSDIEDKALHEWIFLGARAAYTP